MYIQGLASYERGLGKNLMLQPSYLGEVVTFQALLQNEM